MMTLKWLGNLLVILFAILIIAPLLIVLFTSFKTTPQFYASPLGFPESLSFHNFIALFEGQPMLAYFRNSIAVTLSTVALELLTAGCIAYAISRSGKRIGNLAFGLFALGLMVPSQINMIPIYAMIRSLGWTNSLTALIVVTSAVLLPLAVFMLTGFMKTLPKEILEAGEIDGAGEWRLFTRIALPLSAPYFAATAAFLFVIVWNDLLFPMLLLSGKDKLTLPLALLSFRGEYVSNYPQLLAGVVVTALPMIVLFVLLQRYFISGALAGSLKG
ncbi:sugar ABC transporter permease [Paenibacillus sp. 32O-W]|uniref:Sugar ABC transporter permease n=1 Tax=Paenibacillus cisolokensis TaxID=1658519 RepID=A0ABQ4N970_9BACL|nr:carbohydrate ABC transporter permease [Paenibacillus cisolokensis]ALS29634.1 sugar ABC transporter permease [Paenibacillus sp. 32O-W]GIQ64793.1 sugar ABC transporter permease [Paenibacillus cisolokensis]